MSKSVELTYERPGLEKLAVGFLDYYVANKDKLEWKVNIKARFNKFVQSDYHNLLKKKATWPGINEVTDDQFMELLEQWYFRTSSCKFYKDKVRPTLDTQWVNTFNLMVWFFKNKDVGSNSKMTFNEYLIAKGYIIA